MTANRHTPKEAATATLWMDMIFAATTVTKAKELNVLFATKTFATWDTRLFCGFGCLHFLSLFSLF